MSTQISNLDLVKKCKRFILADPTSEALDELIQDALISAERDIRRIDDVPLAWLREDYNELFTRWYAEISAITQADPGVITAETIDDDLEDDHGFYDDDIVYIDGIDGMDELNRRLFRVSRTSATTLTLQWLNDQDDVDTSGYDEYDSGGYIYHAGILVPHSTIEPSSGTEDYRWAIERIFDVTFDLYPTGKISEEQIMGESKWFLDFGRPKRWHHKKYSYSDFAADSVEHYLMWVPPADQKYNIALHLEKSYPNMGTWNTTTYPPHLPEVHDYIWHRALANLATNTERQRRESNEGSRVMGQIEVLYANHWRTKMLEEEAKIRALNREMIGHGSSPGDSWSA